MCGLCNTAHKDGKGQIRKYLFHETCPVFKNYSPERKREYLSKHKLCNLCSLSTTLPRHKKPCFLQERFKCKHCMEAGDSAKALSHHTELHRNLGAPTRKNTAPANSQQAATPVPAVTNAPPISTAVRAAPPVLSYTAPTWPTPVPQQMNTSYYPTAQPLPVLSQPSPTTQPAPANPTIPHHTIGAENFSGFSNQVVRYTGQPQQSQQISHEENQYFQEVCGSDSVVRGWGVS